ncbi:MAG: hypothetical protein PWR27_2072, partial [Petroclostridium sp.]|nr:hypothetical protein [Petroclostridium sp.]
GSINKTFLKMIGIDASDIQRLDSEKRNSILKKAKEIEEFSVLQISRVTGINRVAVNKA